MAANTNLEPRSNLSGERARRRSALFSFPLFANWFPAVMLAAALFMPQVTGCDNLPVRPVDNLISAAEEQPFSAFFVCWQHFYGVFVVVLFACVVASDRATSDRKLAYCTIAFWSLLVASIMIGFLTDFDRDDTGFFVGMLPLVVIPSYLCYAALKRHDWISAWARLATSIAVLGMLWTFASYVFNRGSRYGIFVTYCSLLLLAIAPWWLRVRWRRALISSSEPSTPIRYRIWHVFAATTLLALMYGYYRYVVPMFDG